MIKVYELRTNSEEYAVFYEIYEKLENTFFQLYSDWINIDLNTYKAVKFKLYKADNGKKNFQMDIGTYSGLLILSEKAVAVLHPILKNKGQFIPIETESKRKKFIGFYPNNSGYELDILDMKKTEWRQAEKGKLFYKYVFNENYPKEEYLFNLKEALSTVFVTEQFKELVEKNDLKGFDFNREVKISE